jgi:hypothetical protein
MTILRAGLAKIPNRIADLIFSMKQLFSKVCGYASKYLFTGIAESFANLLKRDSPISYTLRRVPVSPCFAEPP